MRPESTPPLTNAPSGTSATSMPSTEVRSSRSRASTASASERSSLFAIVRLPVLAHLERVAGELERVSRRKLAHAAEHRVRRGNELAFEIQAQCRGIDSGADARVRQHGLDLGAEHERRAVPGVVQRLDAEVIACGEQRLRAGIPQREGEHAAQARDQPFAPCMPTRYESLGIARGAKGPSAARELVAQLAEVVDLAVEDHGDLAVGTRHRLRAAGDVDDGQAAVSQVRPAGIEEAVGIGPAMRERARHRRQHFRRKHRIADVSRDAAHGDSFRRKLRREVYQSSSSFCGLSRPSYNSHPIASCCALERAPWLVVVFPSRADPSFTCRHAPNRQPKRRRAMKLKSRGRFNLKSWSRIAADRMLGTAFERTLRAAKRDTVAASSYSRGIAGSATSRSVSCRCSRAFAKQDRDSRIEVVTRADLAEAFALTDVDAIHVVPGMVRGTPVDLTSAMRLAGASLSPLAIVFADPDPTRWLDGRRQAYPPSLRWRAEWNALARHAAALLRRHRDRRARELGDRAALWLREGLARRRVAGAVRAVSRLAQRALVLFGNARSHPFRARQRRRPARPARAFSRSWP